MTMPPEDASISPEDREACLRVLQAVARRPSVIDDDARMKTLIAKIHAEGKRGARHAARQARQDADRTLIEGTGMVQAQREAPPALAAPGVPSLATLTGERPCYICKQGFRQLHPHYHQLCPECAALNADRRTRRADMAGRAALVTGGRIKIGHQVALRLLRDGARVIVTTRFAADAARRFAAEPDHPEWKDRLCLYALDLRHTGHVETFARHLLDTESSLDVLINNAAQTIRRPRAFYRHLLDGEPGGRALLEDAARLDFPAPPPGEPAPDRALAPAEDFPPGQFDADGQQVDARPFNSWRLRLGEVDTAEMLEVQLVNAVAPFVLCGRLKPLLLRSPFPRRFVVNVSAMEGQFARPGKTACHPHTNMAKAALNMLTRTSAADYARGGIYMNSVDTGWITDENPLPRRERLRAEHGFYPPLDVHDGAARVLAPVYDGLSGPEPAFGQFLKDYAPHPW